MVYEWRRQIQKIMDGIDRCVINRDDDSLTLRVIARENGYSEYHMTRKFGELTGVSFRGYLRGRRLAFALIDVRDTRKSILDIAVDYGFSSHEAFCRSFKAFYDITPSSYRENPKPVVLRTRINTYDRYYFGLGEIGMLKSTEEIKIYFVTIPTHRFLHIKNYETSGYWDFWAWQDKIPGTDCDTICGLLDSVKFKLDGEDGVIGKSSGQIMGWIHEDGKKARAYGVRLPADWNGEVPKPMLLLDVPEAEYIVFEHGKFDYDQEKETVFKKLKDAIAAFDYSTTEYIPDNSPGRLEYGIFDPEKYEKEILPVRRK